MSAAPAILITVFLGIGLLGGLGALWRHERRIRREQRRALGEAEARRNLEQIIPGYYGLPPRNGRAGDEDRVA